MEAKRIEDYLNLYLECICLVKTESAEFKGILKGVYLDRWHGWQSDHELALQIYTLEGGFHTYRQKEVKLILRPLSDMAEEESLELYLVERKCLEPGSHWLLSYGPCCQYLLSKGFDLFGLIEAGIAIDKTTLEKTLRVQD